MYIKITKSGPRHYVQLVESFRDNNGRARQRIIANFGRLEQITDNVESIVKVLLKATGNLVPEDGVLPRRLKCRSIQPALWVMFGRSLACGMSSD